jgi:hypothetical protein
MDVLLSRDEFRARVSARDGGRCVAPNCGRPATVVHHILAQRLWPDGGYYLANGVSVCEPHRHQAEQTVLSCEELREWAGITQVVLPPHLYRDERYDSWGNVYRADGTRTPGELFWDPAIQTILGDSGVLGEFRLHVKYPRTHHLPWSPGVGPNDQVATALDEFVDADGRPVDVVVTEKLDGENTTLYRDYLHARSLDSRTHPSRDWVKGFWAQLAGDIPDGWRICGENLWATH